MKPVRVLHVVFSMVHGGIETFLMSMLRCSDRSKFEMDVMYTGQSEGEYAPEVRSLGSKIFGCRLKYDQIRFVYNFYKILKREKYDAVNVHLADMGGGAMLAAWLARVPVRVASYHTSLPNMGFLRNLYLRIMRSIVVHTATDITTSSPGVTDSHFHKMNVDFNRIHAITYGCDTAAFEQRPQKVIDLSKFGFGDDNIIIGHVGSYRPQKNHDALIKIAKVVIDKIPNARFVLCGATCNSPSVLGYKAQVESKIEQAGLKQYIAQVQGIEDMREFYHAIDIFILPSRHEGMPISIIEAQAAGKPVVASRINGIVLATCPQMQCNLFEIDDIENFANCLIDLLLDGEKRASLGKAGRLFAKKNLDINIAVGKYQNLYLPKNEQIKG